nr:urease accessory protein UreD [Acuticoccus mangrovi]
MVLNTAGGLASGDVFTVTSRAEAHGLTVSTQACERVYRAEGPPARVRQSLSVAAGASLRHLPQPTILYDGSRLDRLTRVDIEEGGALTLVEGLVLGRAAMGEDVTALALADRVEVRLGGRLAFVDALRLDDAALARARQPAGIGAARGIGIVIHRAAGPGSMGDTLEALREALAGTAVVAGASLLNGLLVARMLAPTHTTLQDALAKAVWTLTEGAPPRAWAL